MRIRIIIAVFLAGFMPVSVCMAAEDLGARLDRLDAEIRHQGKIIKQQQKTIELLKKELARQSEKAFSKPPKEGPASTDVTVSKELHQLKERVNEVVKAQKKVLPSEFNPSIGFVGETLFSYRSRGADQIGGERPGGFDVFQRSMELNLAGSVDPFAKAYAVINASADAVTGEAHLGVEEAALQTTSLPWNLEVKAGRFFGEFGRLSYIHNHELPFVNRPLALQEYVGGESRTDGLQINWLAPIEHYVSLTLGAGDQFGEESNQPGGFRGFDELNFFGRLSTYFDLSPNIGLETGVSGLWNPKTNGRGDPVVQPDGSTMTERERRLVDLDFKFNYLPLRNNQFRSFTWGTEVLYSDNRYRVDPDGSLNPDLVASGPSGDEFTKNVGALGLYSYATCKWSRSWSAGFLFNMVQDASDNDAYTYAYSPYLTWAVSHWQQLRLQYTHTDHNNASSLHDNDAVYLQWAWIIGSHAHGWQQR